MTAHYFLVAHEQFHIPAIAMMINEKAAALQHVIKNVPIAKKSIPDTVM